MNKRHLLLIFSSIIVLIVLIGCNVAKSTNVDKEKIVEKELPTITSYNELEKMIKESSSKNAVKYRAQGFMEDDMAVSEMAGTGSVGLRKSNESASFAKDGEHSTTNTQVEGVDESDIIKNDGEYIFHVVDQGINVVKAYPVEEMKIIDKVTLKDNAFEIYVDKDKLVVLCNSFRTIQPFETESNKIPLPLVDKQYVKVIIFDKSDINNIKKINEYKVEGYYISSRKIDDNLYVMTNKNIMYYRDDFFALSRKNIELDDKEEKEFDDLLKETNEDALNIEYSYDENKTEILECQMIHYFDEDIEPNYLIMSSINLSEKSKPNIKAYLGGGSNVYASLDSIYVAKDKYETLKNKDMIDTNIDTEIYKFRIDGDKLIFTEKGNVDGKIINQFAMDEFDGHFRIATTDNYYNPDKFKNNVFVLDNDMKVVGKINNIAPGEKIYSTRFMGEKMYMVTFKTVDPLFVIDMKDHKNPKVLGKLKIPGYSDYLHPYDENHVIGFGKDTIEENGMAYYQGFKMALFDVSDVTNPKEKFVEIIGNRGTYSELLNNHKALLFSREKELLAFPITVQDYTKERRVFDEPVSIEVESGEAAVSKIAPDTRRIINPGYIFNGAYVYNINKDSGFKLKGKLSNRVIETYDDGNRMGYDGNIERIIYIKDVIYTISYNMYKAWDMETLKQLKVLDSASK